MMTRYTFEIESTNFELTGPAFRAVVLIDGQRDRELSWTLSRATAESMGREAVEQRQTLSR